MITIQYYSMESVLNDGVTGQQQKESCDDRSKEELLQQICQLSEQVKNQIDHMSSMNNCISQQQIELDRRQFEINNRQEKLHQARQTNINMQYKNSVLEVDLWGLREQMNQLKIRNQNLSSDRSRLYDVQKNLDTQIDQLKSELSRLQGENNKWCQANDLLVKQCNTTHSAQLTDQIELDSLSQIANTFAFMLRANVNKANYENDMLQATYNVNNVIQKPNQCNDDDEIKNLCARYLNTTQLSNNITQDNLNKQLHKMAELNQKGISPCITTNQPRLFYLYSELQKSLMRISVIGLTSDAMQIITKKNNYIKNLKQKYDQNNKKLVQAKQLLHQQVQSIRNKTAEDLSKQKQSIDLIKNMLHKFKDYQNKQDYTAKQEAIKDDLYTKQNKEITQLQNTIKQLQNTIKQLTTNRNNTLQYNQELQSTILTQKNQIEQITRDVKTNPWYLDQQSQIKHLTTQHKEATQKCQQVQQDNNKLQQIKLKHQEKIKQIKEESKTNKLKYQENICNMIQFALSVNDLLKSCTQLEDSEITVAHKINKKHNKKNNKKDQQQITILANNLIQQIQKKQEELQKRISEMHTEFSTYVCPNCSNVNMMINKEQETYQVQCTNIKCAHSVHIYTSDNQAKISKKKKKKQQQSDNILK